MVENVWPYLLPPDFVRSQLDEDKSDDDEEDDDVFDNDSDEDEDNDDIENFEDYYDNNDDNYNLLSWKADSIHKLSYYLQNFIFSPTHVHFLSFKRIATMIPQDKEQVAIRNRIKQ